MDKPKKLTNFLMKLATEPGALAKFKKDAEAAMKAAGLSAKQKAAVKSRDPKQLKAAVQAEHVGKDALLFTWPIIVTLLD